MGPGHSRGQDQGRELTAELRGAGGMPVKARAFEFQAMAQPMTGEGAE